MTEYITGQEQQQTSCEPIAILQGKRIEIDQWLNQVRRETGTVLNGHHSSDNTLVFHAGDGDSRSRAQFYMATKAPELLGKIKFVEPGADSCDKEIFQNGQPIALLDAKKDEAERWVKKLAKETDAKIDWHYPGGIVQVLFLGDSDTRRRVMFYLKSMLPELKGRVVKILKEGEKGLYRKRVTNIPDNTMATYYNPIDGSEELIYSSSIPKKEPPRNIWVAVFLS